MKKLSQAFTVAVTIAVVTVGGTVLASAAQAQQASPPTTHHLGKGPDGAPVVGVATPMRMAPTRSPDAVWTEGGGGDVTPAYSRYWNLATDGNLYSSYVFAVNLKGETGMVSDSSKRICVNSVLDKIDANDGDYLIRLHNEFEGTSQGMTGWISFPAVVGKQYGYCFTSLPNYDKGDVYTAQFSKKNTTHSYYGHIIATP